MKPRLYLETTIPSYLVARRSRDLRLAADQETTQEWWETERHDYELFISTTVLKEVRRGDPACAAQRLAWLAGIPLLGDLPEANELAKHLLRDEIIPVVAADDATHVALAAAHRMDFLLTWNCTHINNHNIRARIQRACAGVGLACPDICTPAELMRP
ncbi:MAG: type II toxin-antitoxin system VapC family toxin [Verrucomicrobiota bacterium]